MSWRKKKVEDLLRTKRLRARKTRTPCNYYYNFYQLWTYRFLPVDVCFSLSICSSMGSSGSWSHCKYGIMADTSSFRLIANIPTWSPGRYMILSDCAHSSTSISNHSVTRSFLLSPLLIIRFCLSASRHVHTLLLWYCAYAVGIRM